MSNSNKLAAIVLAAAVAATFAGASPAQSTAAAPAANANANAKNQGASPDEVFTRWDKDKNKVLSMEEFRAGFVEVEQANVLRKLHQNFVAMDTNKSGSLEQSEFANLELIKRQGAKAPLMSAFDTDKNGKLDFKEYVGMIGTMVRNKQ